MAEEPLIFRSDRSPDAPAQGAPPVVFERRELDRILRLYGVMVAAGAWRDYAIDFLADAAVFSVYRRTAEAPLYRIEKRPKLRVRQGAFALIAQSGQVLRRGHELDPVLRWFDRKMLKLI